MGAEGTALCFKACAELSLSQCEAKAPSRCTCPHPFVPGTATHRKLRPCREMKGASPGVLEGDLCPSWVDTGASGMCSPWGADCRTGADPAHQCYFGSLHTHWALYGFECRSPHPIRPKPDAKPPSPGTELFPISLAERALLPSRRPLDPHRFLPP